ncbi:MAG TPA: SdrD B-like domain-containing protein [Pirellulaceae bacterium]|nr:SdrD B-like domain-containing protein [Pirellulaceae bacterium]
MGLWQRVSEWFGGLSVSTRRRDLQSSTQRRCHFETLESRQVLSVNPVVVGVTYHEMDVGHDTGPDRFEVTFQGGSSTTQLTSFTINGDQDGNGVVSRGDIIFHASPSIPGAGSWHAFQFDAASSFGITADDIESVIISSDGLSLTVNLRNFNAGDRFVFWIDVDEAESLRFDEIAPGVKFEANLFPATFADPHYQFVNHTITATAAIENFTQHQTSGMFYDWYDNLLLAGGTAAGQTLQLWSDNFDGMGNRSAAAIASYELVPKPISISGNVYHDLNMNLQLDAGESGIGGVLLTLQRWNAAQSQFENVAQRTTDASGFYEFGLDLNLTPGTYRIVQAQPAGFLSVGAVPGTVNGTATGSVGNDGTGQPNVLNNIHISLGGLHGVNYDFFEVRPVSISGTVHANVDGNCTYNPEVGDYYLSGVTLRLLDLQGNQIAVTQTDALGRYVFEGMLPGTYRVVQDQPAGLLDGGVHVGTVNGVARGQTSSNQFLVTLTSGDQGVNYNFCEHVPTQICGYVYHDRNNDGIRGPGEEGIANVVIRLFDAQGQLIAQTTTNAEGRYCFTDLMAGTYQLRQVQPTNFVDGKDTLGTVGGVTVGEIGGNDYFRNIQMLGGQAAVEFNFGELRLARLSGFVYYDADGNQVLDTSRGDRPISGVTLQLLDGQGRMVATTTTDQHGAYEFNNLLPGTYSVRQIQPEGYFTAGQTTGRYENGNAGPGNASTTNLLSNIVIFSGQRLVQYDFQEALPATIAGRVWEDGPAFQTSDGNLPAEYRSQRDGIFQAGIDQPLAGVRMQLYFFIDPTSGNIEPRPVTLADVLPGHYSHLGSDPNTPLWVLTDANGEYRFEGLPAGNYIVLQEQPTGYIDANDMVGSTTGFTFNSVSQAMVAPAAVLQTFSVSQVMDSIVNIRVNAGGISIQNNFTEVRAELVTPPVDPPNPPPINPLTPPITPPRIPNPIPPSPPLAFYGGLAGALPINGSGLINRSASFRVAGNSDPHTWHLSVINGGAPRSVEDGGSSRALWLQASHMMQNDWTRFDMHEASWVFANIVNGNAKMLADTARFGPVDATPLAGDFTGDGKYEIAVFKEGYFFIDINGNGVWDQDDLLVQLGDFRDQPVIGDWDGDGKDDVGIFGPIWTGDWEAIAREPGLPNPDNQAFTRPKNVPPAVVEGAQGARYMKLTAHGKERADLIDHVFGIENGRIIPVVGDWNGNGIHSIGAFDGVQWRLDVNGDGIYDYRDIVAQFGQAGDIPIVGDFNGDGIDQIGVYRNGTWIIDSNYNYQIDDDDLSFVFGSAQELPVVGDWNGDGKAGVGLYRPRP